MSFFSFANGYFGSPPREPQMNNLARSPTIPFCTSPSQLQEVALDQDATFSNTMGLRSPNGPMRGRSVKEFEEQMSSLKKENFNLKLRIYFLEEKLGTHFTLDSDNIVKKNIEYQIEIANLQKEVKEKHELLCQAVKAMELEEEEHKKYSQTKEELVSQMQQEMEDLRSQLNSRLRSHNEESVQIIYEQSQTLRSRFEVQQKEIQAKDETINRLSEELGSANERLVDFAKQIKDYEEKLSHTHRDNQNLILKIQEQQKNLEELYEQYSGVNQKYSSVKYELDREKKSAERCKMMKDMRIGELENENEKSKLRIRDLQSKLDAALVEANKNQNLAVSKSPNEKACGSNTESCLVSVSDPTAPDGTPKKNSLHLPVNTSSSNNKAPPTPDGKSLSAFETLLAEGADVDKLLHEFSQVKNDINAYKQKIVTLKSQQLKACEIIKSMIDIRNKANEEIAQLKKTKEDLERELESVVTKPAREDATSVATPPYEKSMTEAFTEETDMLEQYRALTEALESKIKVLEETLIEKETLLQNVQAQYDEMLEEREHRIAGLEFELSAHLLSVNQNADKEVSQLEKGDTEKHGDAVYKEELEEKNKEIERLSNELKKCTCYLQEIVNKELWEKNREIEKLYKKHENTNDIVKLRKVISVKDMQLNTLKEKISELGLDISLPDDELVLKRTDDEITTLQEQLKIAENKLAHLENADKVIQQLNNEKEKLTHEIERCEELRQETNEVCSVLSTRLEELAIFLDSLLKQKSVLGFLGSAKNKKLREIINNSLDLSRSFSVSLMGNPEESLAQLSNITAFLNGSVFQNLSMAEDLKVEEESHLSIVPSNITLTYQSHLYKKKDSDLNDKQVIDALREQVFNLKSELKLRDIELNKLNNKESGIEKLSETDDDKNQTSQLFTLNKCNTSATLKLLSDAQSESEAWSEPDRVVSRARIGLNHSVPPPSSRSRRLNYNESTEDDVVYRGFSASKRRTSVIELHQEICRLENELQESSDTNQIYCQKLQDASREMDQLKQQLTAAELAKTEAEQQIHNMKKTVNELSRLKSKYEEGDCRNKELLEKINSLESEKEKLLKKCTAFEKQACNAQNEIKQMEEAMASMEVNIQKMYEDSLVSKLKDAEDAFTAKLKRVEEKYEVEMRRAEENIKEMQAEYNRDFVRKSEVETKLLEVEKLVSELGNLKTTVRSYEETIAGYKQRERDINNIIQQYEAQAKVYSEAVLEKTKLSSEKTVLEQELNKVVADKEEAKRQLKETQAQLLETQEKCHEQVVTLQVQKSNLELKLSELESANAQLRNKLIKVQTGKIQLNASMPNIGSRQPVPYKRQCSDQNYSSEDNAEEMRSFCFGRSITHRVRTDAERTEANSSPDLGIESDHGRFSSLETQSNNIPRPLQQMVELTESMNNLFDEQNNQIEGATCANTHCCQTSLEIVRENNDLKRKLVRMKRALEDTAMQLNLANQRKMQVEKTICKQIHKTSQVLRKAKANLDSGSESDILRM